MSDKKSNQYMLTIDSTGKVYEYSEVNESFKKATYAYPKALKELSQHIKNKKLSLPEDSKFSVRVDADNVVTSISLVAEEAPEFSQVFFDSKEEADKAILEKSYRPSYQIMPDEIKELLNNFFNGKVCFFDGYHDLRNSFISEIENASERKHASIKSSYEDKILQKILQPTK